MRLEWVSFMGLGLFCMQVECLRGGGLESLILFVVVTNCFMCWWWLGLTHITMLDWSTSSGVIWKVVRENIEVFCINGEFTLVHDV